jgi:hypothetical protein
MVQRSRKLPIVSGPGKVDLIISEANWQRIENAYGHKLSSSVRSNVLGATKTFILCDLLERRAGPAADAQKLVDTCRKTAENFQCALLAGASSSDAAISVRELIKENFSDPENFLDTRLSNRDQLFSRLNGLLQSFLVACDLSLKELSEPSTATFEKGESWKHWIPQLTEIMREAGLPTGTRKDTDKSKSDRPSPFVALVRELQKCLPDGCRPSTHSDSALAERIVRARASGHKMLRPTAE